MALKGLALASLLAGLALIGYAIAQGDVRVGFFLIVPFVQGTGAAAALGMLLVMAAPVLWVLGAMREMARVAPGAPPPGAWGEPQRASKSGGVILLGPIPIVWGSERGIAKWMLLVAALVTLALVWLAWPR